jgi:CheY-like chemotaxis protein
MARIIVIDDNDAARGTMRRVLEKAGHEVLEASDGNAGLKLLAEIGVTLVITDIFMPGQDGIVTLRRIKKEFPGVRVIAVSGGDSTGRIDLRKDAELLGAARTLRKPFAPAELRRAVEETLALDSKTPPSP